MRLKLEQRKLCQKYVIWLSQHKMHPNQFYLAVAPKLPKVQSIKRTIRSIRQPTVGPVLPSTCNEIVFPPELTITFKGDQFLIYDSGPVEKRIIIFATGRNLLCLSQSSHWYADGTFRNVPLLFHQLYTLHGLREKDSLPLVFGLLPDKTEETYITSLQQIRNIEPLCAPLSITIDFERAMMKPCLKEFPITLQNGCFFCFSQRVFRVIQNNGLKQKYETDTRFALRMRMLPALAFGPIATVTDAFELLCDNNTFLHAAQEVVDYFEDTWIGRPNRRNGRRPPLFRHDMWNMYSRVLDDLPKTNNSLEGWHRRFETEVGVHHPNIWRFIKCLQKEQGFNEVQTEQYVGEIEPEPPRKRYLDAAKRIKRLIQAFDPNNTIDYIREIAHNLSF
ncbi:uncharacterized protein LOC143022389 [Oratosquilla oratoria]|uniref:uncharacterized protein LOC143022389 n=1 Tax=Oratosquilla oratoria TaxID=337810 RepID=UPI003F769C11